MGNTVDNSILDLGAGLLKDIVGLEPENLDDLAPASQQLLRRRPEDQVMPAPPTDVPPAFPTGTTVMTPRALAQQMSHRAFNICYRLNEIIPQAEFDLTMDSLYAVDPLHWGLEQYDNVALLSAVLALACSIDNNVHQALGCADAVQER